MGMRTPMSRVRGLGSAKEGTTHFWRQRLTAIANVPLVIFLLAIAICLVGASHGQVTAAIGSPIVAVLMLAAMISITAHMWLGMQVVIEDYIHGEGLKVLLLIGNGFFAALMALGSIFAILKMGFGG